jgi:Protein of unknown function (DUF2630)
MEDGDVLAQINQLAGEEHALFDVEARGAATAEVCERLRRLEIMLDQHWDLLRQRRALRAAGRNPDRARVRDQTTVEGYRD